MIRRIVHFLFYRYRRFTLGLAAMFLLWYTFCLPRPLFDTPYSMVVESREGRLLGARIAADGQWRFPTIDSVPYKFEQSLLTFEDHRFYRHPGIDPVGIARAVRQNWRAGEVVSGGSTISMQLIRMALGNPPRTLLRKMQEAVLATRLEVGYSKREILRLYTSQAPFGGNVVGLEAAAWRYYGKRPGLLSWSEAATLAVLPNSPALIHPGRNREALLRKRNRLLRRMAERGIIDGLTLELALEEVLPQEPRPLPNLAPHLMDRMAADGLSGRVRSSLQYELQRQALDIVAYHHQRLRGNEIHNLAVLLLDVESGEALAYIGNEIRAGEAHGAQVDVVPAPRSTGSILKPWLYALALQEGVIMPQSLLQDIPMQLSGYRPENFHEDYDGVVPARRALVRSLNVPMVRLLQSYGLERFHYRLRQLGLSSITRPASHYGLPLVLGGAEASLWEISGVYASMARTLAHYGANEGQYSPEDFRMPVYLPQEALPAARLRKQPQPLSAGAVWQTFEAMQEVERPGSEGEWELFRSSQRIAWKTGTSFGFRDAWAIGLTPRYLIGVWAGNADGEGRPGLVGVRAAAPVLFDLFTRVPASEAWFAEPYDELPPLLACATSGYRPLPWCPKDTVFALPAARRVAPCPYHQQLLADTSGRWRVAVACTAPQTRQRETRFVLPPAEEHFYRKRHPDYRGLPPWRSDCRPADGPGTEPMALIYPQYPTKIYVPRGLDGERSRTVFVAAHRNPGSEVHWHLDGHYLLSTQDFHSVELDPPAGRHLLTLVDEDGFRLEQRFEVIDQE